MEGGGGGVPLHGKFHENNIYLFLNPSYSVCNQCVALSTNRQQSRNEAEHKLATDLSNQHKVVVGGSRRRIQEIKQSAVTLPSDNLFIQVQILNII